MAQDNSSVDVSAIDGTSAAATAAQLMRMRGTNSRPSTRVYSSSSDDDLEVNDVEGELDEEEKKRLRKENLKKKIKEKAERKAQKLFKNKIKEEKEKKASSLVSCGSTYI